MPPPAQPPRTARREPLSRHKVVRAGIELADREGLEAVTMRRLADPLGVVPMALYKHVADKEDLLDGMVDALIQDMPAPIPRPPEQWRAGLRDALLGARAVLGRHDWARRAIETRTERTPAVLGHMERVSQVFLGAGFSADLTHHVMHLLGNRIWGFSPELFGPAAGSPAAPPRRRSRAAPTLDPADYPAIVAIAADAKARRPDAASCDEDVEFAFALDVLLDAIDGLHRAGWTSG